MKLFRKILSGVLAAATALTTGAMQLTATPASAADSAIDIAEKMGMGWNLGNTFDSAGVAGYATADGWVNTETAWGNPKTTKAMIDTLKSYGFQSIRLPVTWYENMDSSYKINDAYLARVKEVVDYCVDDGLYVMLNMHHDGASSGSSASSNAYSGAYDQDGIWKGTSKKDKLTTAWKQIATYFKSYDEHLIFEGWNEICWTYDVEQTMAQAFVDTVRATGGNNATRLLVIPANNTDLEAAMNSGFKMPTDSANKLGIDIHFYYPSTFAVAKQGESWGYTSTWGTDSDVSEMKNNVNRAYQKFAANGIPVFWGEASVLTNEGKDAASIRKWIQTLYSTSLGYKGVVPMLWDDSNSGGHCYFDRKNLTWFDAEIGKIFKNMTGVATNTTTAYTFDGIDYKFTTTEEGGWLHFNEEGFTIDIKQFKGLANITGVKVDYTAEYETGAKDPCFGLTVACNGYFTDEEPYENKDQYKWMYNQASVDSRESTFTFLFDDQGMSYSENDTDYGPFTQEGTDWHLAYDFIQFQSWWGSNCGDFTINSVTVLFDTPIVIEGGEVVIPEVTTTQPAETTTTVTTTTVPASETKYGDVDCNSLVNIADAILLAQYCAEISGTVVTPQGLENAGLLNDNAINGDDLTILLEVLAGIRSRNDLPIQP